MKFSVASASTAATATAALILLGLVPPSLGEDLALNGTNGNGKPKLRRHEEVEVEDEVPRGNLRVSSSSLVKKSLPILDESNNAVPVGVDTKDSVSLEEDEQVWKRILQQDFSFPPTPNPTRAPITPPPTTLPPVRPEATTLPPVRPADEECDLLMNIECVVVEGNDDEIRRPCEEVLEPEEDDECSKDVQYVYQITNTCDPNLNENCDAAVIKNFDTVRNGSLKNLLGVIDTEGPGASLDPTETVFFIERGLKFDFCSNTTVDTSSIIVGSTAPGPQPGICIAEASNIFTIGFVPDNPCKAAVDLTCFVEDDDGGKRNCKDVPMPATKADCVKEVTYAYIITNMNSKDKTILDLSRTRDGETVDLRGFLDKRDVGPGQFALARETGELDFCEQRLVTTTVDVTSEAFGVGELSCSDQDTLVFSIAITCDVDVEAQCFADATSDFTIPCDEHNPFDKDTADVGCEHLIKFVYTITNTGPGDEVIETLEVTRKGSTNNILKKKFNLAPDASREVIDFVLVDYCAPDADDVKTEVRVNADMIPLGGSCYDAASYEYSPEDPPCDVRIQPFIKCTLEDDEGNTMLCLDYIEDINDPEDPAQCLRTVKYEVTMVNDGLACLPIESVTGRLSSTPESGALDITPAPQVTVCPGESYIIEVFNDQDLCDDDLEEEIVIEINGGPAEVCGGFGSLTYIPPPEGIEECNVNLDLFCTKTDGSPCVITQVEEMQCDMHPTFLEFKFSAGNCSTTTNTQDGKFTCSDLGAMELDGGGYIEVTTSKGGDIFSASVARGQKFNIGDSYNKLDANIAITVFDKKGGKMIQRMNLHASCSEPLITNDIFGALTLVGFGDKQTKIEAPDNDFQIKYDISNAGDTIALLEEIVFYLGGDEISRTYLNLDQLQPGGTTDQSELFEINAATSDDVTLSASLFVESLSAIACNVDDSISIDVVEPTKPPSTECKCTDRPHAFKFKFTGGSCDGSENQQTYWCTDKFKLLNVAHIIVTNVEESMVYFDGIVKKDQLFEVISHHHAFQEYVVVKVMSKDLHNHQEWTVSQIVKFHSNCEEPLFLGNTFGSIEIDGWKNKSQGKVFVGHEDHC